MMTCDGTGMLSSVLWLAICVSTEVATASAAERTLSPLGEAVTELCWITGAGEPVGSELSFGLSAWPEKEKGMEGKEKKIRLQ